MKYVIFTLMASEVQIAMPSWSQGLKPSCLTYSLRTPLGTGANHLLAVQVRRHTLQCLPGARARNSPLVFKEPPRNRCRSALTCTGEKTKIAIPTWSQGLKPSSCLTCSLRSPQGTGVTHLIPVQLRRQTLQCLPASSNPPLVFHTR